VPNNPAIREITGTFFGIRESRWLNVFVTAQALPVASVGGAAASSSAFGTQTYASPLAYPGSTSSTAGCRIKIINVGDAAVSSTTDALLPPSFPQRFKVTPGQRVSAISNDAGTFSLSITELTK